MACSGERLRTEPSSIQSCITGIEKAGHSIQESTDNIANLIKNMTGAVENANDDVRRQVQELVANMESISLRLQDVEMRLSRPVAPPRLLAKSAEHCGDDSAKQSVISFGQYRVFSICNPLQMMSEDKPWQSPVVCLGGTMGYRAAIRVYMSGNGFAKGESISVYFHLTPGPYDEWLRWPFPGKSISMAIFRTGGQPAHVVTVQVRPDQKAYARPVQGQENDGAPCTNFYSIERLMDDGSFLNAKMSSSGKDDVLLIGFAVEGEETFCPALKDPLEARITRIESVIKHLDKLPADFVERINRLPCQSRRNTYSRSTEPFQEYYCC